MRTYTLFDDTTTQDATAAGNGVPVSNREVSEGTLQVALASTGTVQLQGRLSPTAAWVDVGDPFTASGALIVAAFEAYRVIVSANGSGVKAAILI